MAGIGLQYCGYAPLTEDEVAGTYSYGIGKRGRKLMKTDIKINTTKSTLYGDDGVAETSREFIDGEMSVNQDEFTNAMKKDLLGNTTKNVTIGTETIEEVVSKDTDTPPFVGYGYIQSKMIDKVRKYRAVFFTKVQFGEPDESAETKAQNISWQTPSFTGSIMRRIDGEWKDEATVSTLATAIAWLKAKLNLPPVTTLSSLIIGALTLTPSFSREVISYTASTTNATDIIVVVPTDPEATVAILKGTTPVVNGQAATWSAGANTLKVTVTNEATTKEYTVIVTKS